MGRPLFCAPRNGIGCKWLKWAGSSPNLVGTPLLFGKGLAIFMTKYQCRMAFS